MEVDSGYANYKLSSQPFLVQEDINKLRKLKFPVYLHEALRKLECLVERGLARVNKKHLSANVLIDEFIVCSDKINSSVQLLQHLNILNQFFSRPSSASASVSVFMTVFLPSVHHCQQQLLSPGQCDRVDTVCALVSLALSLASAPLLLCAGVWIQQLGFASPAVRRLADQLITEHFPPSAAALPHSALSGSDALSHVAQVAPHFLANLLTAATRVYTLSVGPPAAATDSSRSPQRGTAPPLSLLKQVICWLDGDPSLPLCPLVKDICPLLPHNSVPMPGACALFGMFSWTVLQPVYFAKQCPAKTEAESLGQSEVNAIYSQLHYRLITSTLELRGVYQQQGAISAAQLFSVQQLGQLCSQLAAAGLTSSCGQLLSWQQLSLDRLGQMFQCLVAVGGLQGSLDDAVAQLRRVCSTPLIELIVAHHR